MNKLDIRAIGELDRRVLDTVLMRPARLDGEAKRAKLGEGCRQIAHGNRDVVQVQRAFVGNSAATGHGKTERD